MNDQAVAVPTRMTLADLAFILHIAERAAHDQARVQPQGHALARRRLRLRTDPADLRAGISNLLASGRASADGTEIILGPETSVIGLALHESDRWVEIGVVRDGRPSVLHFASGPRIALILQRLPLDVYEMTGVAADTRLEDAVMRTAAALLDTTVDTLVVNAIGFAGATSAAQIRAGSGQYAAFRRISAAELAPGVVDAIVNGAEPPDLGWQPTGSGALADALACISTLLPSPAGSGPAAAP